MLPVRREGDAADVFVDRGVFAASGGRGISAVTKPADVPEDAWDAARVRAANQLIAAYGEMDRDAPDSLYEIAGREPPSRTITIPIDRESFTRAVSTGSLHGALWSILFDHDLEYAQDNWFIDVYFDDDKVYALVADHGKLYRYDITISGTDITLSERIEIMEVHEPVSQNRSIIRQQSDGRWRWYSVSATSTLNRMGEIDSRDLFDNFSRRCRETGDYPIRDFYHRQLPFRVGQADFIARHGNALVTSGLYDQDNELAAGEIAARQRDPDYWGDSIEFYTTGEPDMVPFGDVKIPVYRDGEIKFISTLPVSDAASFFTRGRVQEVRRQMNDAERTAIVQLFDSESAADEWLEANVDPVNRAIEKQGMITRAVDDESAAGTDEPAVVDNDDDDDGEPVATDDQPLVTQSYELNEADMLTIGEAVFESSPQLVQLREAVDTLTATVTTLTEQLETNATAVTESLDGVGRRLDSLEEDEGEKKRKYIEDLPRKVHTVVTHRPRIARAEGGDENAEPTLAAKADETLSNWKRGG